mmetsp:Transcript_17346/g.44397  ORF Transcript_17346/g.44397 Transcript_17346/m.44397 type:complete len:331 (-) Transcript_17346:249-1241(-)
MGSVTSQWYGAREETSSTRLARDGKCVLLTGVASGLGLTTARMLVHEGVQVIGCDREAGVLDALAAELGSRFMPVACDMTDPGSMDEAAQLVRAAQSDGIDGIVHFAGMHSAGPLMELSEQEFSAVFNVNVVGVWRTQCVFFELLRMRRGRTVFISSEVGYARFCHAFSGAYSMSKVALDELGTVLRQEYACLEPPMEVVTFHLGMFSTPLLSKASTSFSDAAARFPESPFAPALRNADALARWFIGDLRTVAHTARYSPERVSQKVLEVLETRRPRRRYGLNVSWGMYLVSFIPQPLLDALIVSTVRGGVAKGFREALTSVLTALLCLF